MKRIVNASLRIILGFAVVVSLWLTMTNILSIGQDLTEIKNGYACLILLGMLAVFSITVLVPRKRWEKIVSFFGRRIVLMKVLLGLVVLLAGVARFSFLALEYSPHDNDPASFYSIASTVATENSFGNQADYIALFPYVMNYNLLLGLTMKIFGVNLFSVILLNTLLDIIAVVLLDILLRRLTENTTTAKFGAILWWVSPFNVIFSALSLPVIAVNTLIMAVLLLILLLMQNLHKKSAPLYALSAGVTLSIANSLRPIMIIFIIALMICLLLDFLLLKQKHVKILRIIATISAMLIPYFILNNSYIHLVSAMTGVQTAENSSGWSIYVGANLASTGQWNTENGHLDVVLEEEESLTAAQARLAREGVARWLSMSGSEVMQMLVRKSLVLGGDQADAVYDIKSYPGIWEREYARILIHIACTIYALFLTTASLLELIAKYRDKTLVPDFSIYIGLVIVGLFFASLLVEVSSRYFTPFLPLITLLTILYLAPRAKLLYERVTA